MKGDYCAVGGKKSDAGGEWTGRSRSLMCGDLHRDAWVRRSAVGVGIGVTGMVGIVTGRR